MRCAAGTLEVKSRRLMPGARRFVAAGKPLETRKLDPFVDPAKIIIQRLDIYGTYRTIGDVAMGLPVGVDNV
jgi:hypothetical protein